MSEQPEALRLANFLEMHWCNVDMPEAKAAAELRFLHAENEALRRERDEARRTVREAHEAGTRLTAQRDALLKALIGCRDRFFPVDQPKRDRDLMWEPVNAAIKAVEEGK